jgi:hypothetical protein
MESKIESEKRRVQRFSLKAFAVVQSVSPGTEQVFKLSTQDISSRGVFFPEELPVPAGERVKVTLYLPISVLQRIKASPSMAKITTQGQVVRSTLLGTAVAFDGHYTISPAFA